MNSIKKCYPYNAWRNHLAEEHWVFPNNRLNMLDSMLPLPVIWTRILSKDVFNILQSISAFPYQNLSTIAPYSYFIHQESTPHLSIFIVRVHVFLLLSTYFYCSSMYFYCCLCILIVRPCILIVVYVFLSLSWYSYCCLCILIFVYVFLLLSM